MTTNELKNDITSIKRDSWLNEFLWSCAGVNKHVLRQCPSDYSKYAGIGGTILFTALMAALSGGYALNFVFDNTYIAIGFGVFWGLLIFNLDRFIVNTMYSDGKYTISWGELRSGLPRIIMAIFLGIVISTPLELKIFYKEIDAQMQKDMKVQIGEYVKEDKALLDSLRTQRERLREAPLDAHFVGTLGSTDLEVQRKVNELSNLRKTEAELNNQILNLTSQIRKLDASHNHNDSIMAKQLRDRRNPIQNQLNNTRSQIRELDVTVRSLSADYKGLMEKAEHQREKDINYLDERIQSLEGIVNESETSYRDRLKENFGGLRAQLRAFSELRKEDRSTDIAAWVIMFLFVIIEIAPTFFKMMMEDGPYDNLLNAEKHRTKVLADKRISDVNDAVNTCVRISTMKNEKRLEAEIIANKDILERIAKAQSELLETAIEQWKKVELEKIRKNPTAYIVTSALTEDKQENDDGVLSEFMHNEANELIEDNGKLELQNNSK